MPQQLSIVKEEPLTIVGEEPLSVTDERPAESSSLWPTGDVIVGAAKGIGRTAVGLGRLVTQIPGVSRLTGEIPEGAESALGLDPTNPGQRIGMFAEQAGEYLVPAARAEKIAAAVTARMAPRLANAPKTVRAAATLVPRAATQATAAGSVSAAQGADPTAGAALGGAMPVIGGAATAAARFVGSKAVPLVQAAIKPTVTAMRRVAGASQTGLDAQARALVGFIIDERIVSAHQARTIVTAAENELQRVLSTRNAPTDAPQRAIRYLSALERSAKLQGLPDADVATLRNAAAEVLESGLGKDVIAMVPAPHPTLVAPNGRPIQVLVPRTTRQLRTDVMADEALTRARANSRWDTRKQWGEQKGAQMEASKAVERAERDALKEAVPETRPILARQGQAIRATDVLDRMELRTGNRDAASLPAHVIAAGEIATGRLPILAFAANWLRNNQLKAGIWASRLDKAIKRQDVQAVSTIMGRLGVGTTAQATGTRR